METFTGISWTPELFLHLITVGTPRKDLSTPTTWEPTSGLAATALRKTCNHPMLTSYLVTLDKVLVWWLRLWGKFKVQNSRTLRIIGLLHIPEMYKLGSLFKCPWHYMLQTFGLVLTFLCIRAGILPNVLWLFNYDAFFESGSLSTADQLRHSEMKVTLGFI